MKSTISLCLAILIFLSCQTNSGNQNTTSWQPKGLILETPWTKEVTPENVHQEYPRPQMVRKEWLNLNGLWDYAILPRNQQKMDSTHGQILVPFPIESSLSGVKKKLIPEERLWYKRAVSIPENWVNHNILLHFEAVDWETTLWVNGEKVGTHQGGYDPFSFDISHLTKAGEVIEIQIAVWDPTDSGHFNPRGKQVLNPSGIYYTPSSGIWQTLWLEPVPQSYISSFKVETDIDKNTATFKIDVTEGTDNQEVVINYEENGSSKSVRGNINESIIINLNDAKLWSPENPHLYDIKIQLEEKGKVRDEVNSYFAMRKIALGKDEKGFTRMLFNNEFVFQNGPLDQGFWPDGQYTAPSDEALKYDIEMTKKMGFNMLRKHVKIEPRRFYYWCDKLGILVWQDMPNAHGYVGKGQEDITVSPEHDQNFRNEVSRMISNLFNHPCIVMWVPFNEGWGQYQSEGITDYVKGLDPTRLVNLASGWQDRGTGDVLDIHNYPHPKMPSPEENRAVVLGEFGGLGYPVKEHLWTQKNWGYKKFQDLEEMTLEYENFYSTVWSFMEQGLSATVYTQTTDVETETNGLLTYDRRVLKMEEPVLYAINTNDYVPVPQIIPYELLFNSPINVSISQKGRDDIYYSLDGSSPSSKSKLYKGAITISETTEFRAVAISKSGKESRIIRRKFEKTDQKEPFYLFKYARQYNGGGQFALIDGKKGSQDYGDGLWQGYQGNPLIVAFEFPKSRKVEAVKVRFLQNQRAWIFPPVKIRCSVSENGKDFQEIRTQDFELSKDDEIKIVPIDFENFPESSIKYLKIEAENIENCPDWHPGAGGKCWLFVDEVEVF